MFKKNNNREITENIPHSVDGINKFRPNNLETEHYRDLISNPYYKYLLMLRQNIKLSTSRFFIESCGATDIDLFMITKSISSPMGRGSDSKALPVKFGKYKSYLTDSSQFGFEPLLINNFQSVFCYMPSMRGEDPDSRHLNQFFHAEFETIGCLEDVMQIAERYLVFLCSNLLKDSSVIFKIASNYDLTENSLIAITNASSFPRITFNEAVEILLENGYNHCIKYIKGGMSLTPEGEVVLATLMKFKLPFWITHYQRDMSPFYQKPDPNDINNVLNADLILPPLIDGGFGGEVLGAGERQNNDVEMLMSLMRQKVKPEPYAWYIELRKTTNYKTTSGFGLGIERLITWILGYSNIKDVILYPRLKNSKTNP